MADPDLQQTPSGLALLVEYVLLDTEGAHWCPTCALPSAHRYSWALVGAVSLRVLGHTAAIVCEGCGCYVPLPPDGS